jgi:quercetin dioxygenase-like cupin family protein
MIAQHVNWDGMDWRPVRRGIERKSFTGEGMTLAMHRLWPGHEVLPHSHLHEQIAYIIEGEVDFLIGEQTVRLTAGGVALIPPNVVHCAKVVGDGPALNLDVFCPARPDYLA